MSLRAFSLIELLVAIAIIGVLAALLNVSIGAVRANARQSQSLTNLRSHCQIFSIYNNDHRSMYPSFTRLGNLSFQLQGGGLSLPVSYFDASRTWHIALADQYYGGDATAQEFFPPQYARGQNGWPLYNGYEYGCAFIATPEYWRPETRIGPSQWMQSSSSGVLFPESKVLLAGTWPAHSYAPDGSNPHADAYASMPVGMCDASARLVSWRNRMNGYERGDGVIFHVQGAVHFTDYPPLLHTLDGIRGRDIR